jgi:choline dehydrogenase-like flavoprotein
VKFDDARTVESGTTLSTGVCVVGAGAAGIALATAFAERGVETLVVEAGGMGRDLGTQSLYRGRVTGGVLPYDYLVTSRLRQFGGTTNHWGGRTLPINAHVFGPRRGVPGGEWPFPRSELDPYYARAARFLGASRPYRASRPVSGDAPFIPVSSYPIRHVRLRETYRETLERSRSVRILLFGNVVALETEADGRRLRTVKVATLGGNKFSVEARVFVIATGAIENARLLLQPSQAHPHGLANEHDLVGRYFTEHVFLPPGRVVRASQRWPRVATLSAGLQARHELLDVEIDLRGLSNKPGEVSRAVLSTTRVMDEPSEDPRVYRSTLSSEAFPQWSNRVTLTTERDELGQQACTLHFALSDIDRHNLHETQRILTRVVGERGWGRLRHVAIPLRFGLGNHHIGTTRMNRNPRVGVVDAQCRVHSVTNLFIAGSSVFPSAGAANPTFTLVALAFRLADHLTRGIRDGAFNRA